MQAMSVPTQAEMIQLEAATSNAAQKQAVQELIQKLKNNPGPEQQQQLVQLLKNSPQLMAAFIKHRQQNLQQQSHMTIDPQMQQTQQMMQQNMPESSQMMQSMPCNIPPSMIQPGAATSFAAQKQAVQELIQKLKNNPGPEQQQQLLQWLKANPQHMIAFIKQRQRNRQQQSHMTIDPQMQQTHMQHSHHISNQLVYDTATNAADFMSDLEICAEFEKLDL